MALIPNSLKKPKSCNLRMFKFFEKMFGNVMRLFLLSACITLLLCTNLYAQDTLSVEEAVAIGLENNYSIRIARNQSEVADNNNSLGNAGFLPSLTGSASRTERIEDNRFSTSITDTSITGARSNATNASINLNWTFFDGLKMFTTYDKLGELQELGEQRFRLTVENNVAQIISAYFDIIRQQKIYEVLENTVEISEQRIQIAETRKDIGSGSKYDLLQARADLNADKASVIRQEVSLNSAKVRLNELLGRNINTFFNVQSSITLNGNLVYSELIQQALANNLVLSVARTNQKVAELEIKEIRGERYPEINLNAGYGYNRTESSGGFFSFNETNGFNYGISTRINIWNGFNINRRIQNAKIELKNQEIAVEEQKQEVEANLSTEYKNYVNSLMLVELETANLTYAQQSLDIALERFKLGTINSIELREVQRTLISAESRLIQAQFEAKLAETELQRISGQLTQKPE